MSYVRSISVRDEADVGLTVYEFRDRSFPRLVKRWELCSGESVTPEGDGFVVVDTGEYLKPSVASSSRRFWSRFF